MNNEELFLRGIGGTEKEIFELSNYNKNLFDHKDLLDTKRFPIEDEAFVKHWEKCINATAEKGIVEVLKDNFIQLHFPVVSGMSKNEEYLEATRQGTIDVNRRMKNFLELEYPEGIKLYLHSTYAGRIPVIFTSNRKDFVLLVQALAGRNEPINIPNSMGACMVKGYNNWGRIFSYKSNFESEFLWNIEKQSFFSNKELYQDRFIILSDGGYSGVSAQDMKLSEGDWKNKSLAIRLEHEGVHYFTERVLGSSKANIFDEFIADYMGIVKAFGAYKAEVFLRFMGLEDYPDYRQGGRLENYKGKPSLSDASFKILQKLVRQASVNLEGFDNENTASNAVDKLIALTKTTLIDLASNEFKIIF
jgi:hypothetical protein